MTLRDFLAILRTNWWILLTCVLLAGGAAYYFTSRITPVYQANTRIFLASGVPVGGNSAPTPTPSPSKPKATPTPSATPGVSGGASATPTAKATKTPKATTQPGYIITSSDLQTYLELVASPVVLDPLRKKLELPADLPIDISASVSSFAPVLDISVKDSDPQRAAAIANEVGPQLTRIGGKYTPLLAAAGQQVASTSILPAAVPSSPISPNLNLNLVIGLLAGLALGIGVALLRHALDTKVRSQADVKAVSDLPILGSLRRLKDAGHHPLVVNDEPRSPAAEEYRRLRTNLQFVDVTTGGRHSFVVTSSMPSEGKTTTVVNLALAAADSGLRVLLVDADLRNPSVAKTMGLEGAVGLTTILLGHAKLEDVAQPWRGSSLSVLPAGTIPPNPSELLGSEAMATLFTEFLEDYDFVLVDSPPILPVIDPALIGKMVGATLVVVSAGRTRTNALSQALKQLETTQVPVAGFALNMVSNNELNQYGRGYGYGYGRDAKPGRRAKRAAEDPDVSPAAARRSSS